MSTEKTRGGPPGGGPAGARRAAPKNLTVVGKEFVSPHMLRVTLGGPELESYSAEADGGYIKLVFDSGEAKPIVRTYTVRKFRRETLEIDVDFVVHDTDGPASAWAKNCQAGDPIMVGGPGGRKLVSPEADWVLMAGDMSALPAMSVNLEVMDRNARGYALLEIMHADDRQQIDAPENVIVKWIVNPQPEEENSILFNEIKSVEWLDGQPYVWVAGELGQSLAIRSFMKKERGITRHQMYASSYWQIGQTEDGHKIAKREAEQKS